MPTTIHGMPYYEVDFNSDGSLNTQNGSGDGGLPAALAAGGITDVFVLSHGWNNGVDSAHDLYQDMFGKLSDQIGDHRTKSAAVGVIWPSLLFPDDDPATAPPVPSTGAQIAAALKPAFPDQTQQLTKLGNLLDTRPQDSHALVDFHSTATQLVTTPPQGEEDSGEASLLSNAPGANVGKILGHAAAMAPASESDTQGVGNPFDALWNGARMVWRTLSYYEMKNRAG